MSEEDPAAARAALAAEAQRLKEKRAAEESSQASNLADARQNYQREIDRFDSGRLRKSWSHVMVFWTGVGLAFLAQMAAFAPPDLDGVERTYVFGPISIVLTVIGVALIAFHHTGAMRAQRWVDSLPFKFQGLDLLGIGESVTKASLHVQFKDTRPEPAVVEELLRARVPNTTMVASHLVVSDLERFGTNQLLAKWLRASVNKVLLDVHRGYPIESVRLVADERREFYIPSGD